MANTQRLVTPTTGRRCGVVVVGGGISGLAAAHRLHELAPSVSVRLFEAAESVGGILRTERRGGYLVEHGADSLLTREPWGLDLCRRVGLQPELIPTNDQYRRAFVVYRGRLHAVPAGFVLMQPRNWKSVLSATMLSWSAKFRLLREYWVPVRDAHHEESVADFAIRRLGRETYDRLVQPLVGGIYTGDPRRLSMAATLPRFLAAEREHGSLTRAAWRAGPAAGGRSDAGAGYSQFVAPRLGMGRLADGVAQRLPDSVIQCGCGVTAVAPRADGGWNVLAGDPEESWQADGLILATPAASAGRLIAPVDAQLAARLGELPMAGASVVTLGYASAQIRRPLHGFGLVVPHIERRRILAASFSSVKFQDRAPHGRVLIRVFLGGALQPELNEMDDGAVSEIAQRELADLLGATGEPELVAITRWQGAMPQYELGHHARVMAIESCVEQLPGLQLAGNALHGVGVPACIHSGEQAAERTLDYLHRSNPES